jgi:hypothetical protein
MKCNCGNTMYSHDHVREVFADTSPTVKELYGCRKCHGSVIVRTNNAREFHA